MKRYLLSYLAAYVASLAAFGVIMVIAISNWFFTDSPLWFDVLGVIVTALPAFIKLMVAMLPALLDQPATA